MKRHVGIAIVLAIGVSIGLAILLKGESRDPTLEPSQQTEATTRSSQDEAAKQRLRSLGYLN